MPTAAIRKLVEIARSATTPILVIWAVSSASASDSKMDMSWAGKSMKISMPISIITPAQISATRMQE